MLECRSTSKLGKTMYKACKQYRVSIGVKQSELGNVKAISAYENGRSTNINHFIKYFKLAQSRGELEQFYKLLEGVKNG